MPDQYDAIIGTGAGGGTLALYLAHAGKRILILERGPFLPQEKLNWDTSAVFLDNRYHTKDVWVDKDEQLVHPQQAYFVGGQPKSMARPCSASAPKNSSRHMAILTTISPARSHLYMRL